MSNDDPFGSVKPSDVDVRTEPGTGSAPVEFTDVAAAPEGYLDPSKSKDNQPQPTPDEPVSAAEPEGDSSRTEPTPEPEDVQTPPVGTTVTDWEQNYNELRKKFNERDSEISELRRIKDEFEKGSTERQQVESRLKEVEDELNQYKEWYDKNAPMMLEAAKDPVVAQKLQEIQDGMTRPLTQDEIRKIVQAEQQAQAEEARRSAELDHIVDSFTSDNKILLDDPLVSDEFSKAVDKLPDGQEIDRELLEVLMERSLRKLGRSSAADQAGKQAEEERQRKIAEAKVGGNATASTPAQPPKKESLFARPPGSVGAGGLFG